MSEAYHRNSETLKLLFNTKEASKAIGLSLTSIYNLMRNGEIRYVIVAGRRLIPRGELEALASGIAKSA